MKKKQWQFILAGTGGQGLILAGAVLAKAAISEAKKVIQTSSYGAQSRGGFSQAEVIISDGEIYFMKCDKPNFILALSQAAYDKYKDNVTSECIILYDHDTVISNKRMNDKGYSFNQRAIELGNSKVINSVALGAILKLCPILENESVIRKLKEELPEKVVPLNLEAFEVGYREVTP